jgi:hypothetical protein
MSSEWEEKNERYKYNNLLLDFVRRAKDTQTLKHYVSDAGCTSIFRQKAPNLLGPSDRAVLSYRAPMKRPKV